MYVITLPIVRQLIADYRSGRFASPLISTVVESLETACCSDEALPKRDTALSEHAYRQFAALLRRHPDGWTWAARACEEGCTDVVEQDPWWTFRGFGSDCRTAAYWHLIYLATSPDEPVSRQPCAAG